MKKLFCIILIIILMACTACQQETAKPLNIVTVYYRAPELTFGTADGVITPYMLDATGHEGDIEYLLNAYFSNAQADNYANTFPCGTRLVSVSLDALTAKVVLCDEFAELSGLNLTIACASITQTVISLTGCQEVIISAETAQLDGNNFITLSSDSYLLLDESGGAD